MAYVEEKGNYSCPNAPRKPDPPRSWGGRDGRGGLEQAERAPPRDTPLKLQVQVPRSVRTNYSERILVSDPRSGQFGARW